MKLDEDYEDFFYVKIYLFFVHTSGEVWKKTYLLFVHPPGEVQGKGLTFFLLRERRWRPTFFLLIRLLKFKFKKIFFGHPDLFFFFHTFFLFIRRVKFKGKAMPFVWTLTFFLFILLVKFRGKAMQITRRQVLLSLSCPSFDFVNRILLHYCQNGKAKHVLNTFFFYSSVVWSSAVRRWRLTYFLFTRRGNFNFF